jgi:hypothetical protein
MRQNNLYTAAGIIVLLAIMVLVAFTYAHPSAKPEHVWATFENTALGFILAYPSDLLTPGPGAATATTSINFPFLGRTADGNAGDGIRIATEDTDAKDAAAYFASPDIQTPVPPTPVIVGGLPAMELDEMAYADYSLYIVRDGKLYVIVINLPPAEAQYVKHSIQFVAKPLVYTDGSTYSVGTYHASPIVNGLKSYSSARFGLSFSYPENFSLFEGGADTSGASPSDGYISISPEPYTSQALGREFAGELPPAMAFSFYRNTQHLSLDEWVRQGNPAYTNYNPFYDPTANVVATTVAGGVPAFRYHSEMGLYVTDYVVFMYKDWAVQFSINDMGADTAEDSQTVLSSLTLRQ